MTAGDTLPGLADALQGLGALAAPLPSRRNAVSDFSHALVNTLSKSALVGGTAAATAEVLAHKQQAHGALLQALHSAGLLVHGAAAPPVRPPCTAAVCRRVRLMPASTWRVCLGQDPAGMGITQLHACSRHHQSAWQPAALPHGLSGYHVPTSSVPHHELIFAGCGYKKQEFGRVSELHC